MIENISFKLNGKPVTLNVEGDRMLLWVLRTELGLTGTKFGCGEGFCGACTVLINDEAVRSCQQPVKNVKGKSVVTIEGLAVKDRLHPLQEAFLRNDAFQCGYCTSGMILTAFGLLHKKARPTRDEIIQGMDSNLCRCGAHQRIIQAIVEAAYGIRGR